MKNFLILLLFIFSLFISSRAQNLPEPTREFRAAWIATVDNIDFPTRKNLSAEEQKAEIIGALELAQKLKLNAVLFQARPMTDALYQSKIEPWSEFLTGAMNRPNPQNFDPLEFIITEAHRRGILVHVWLNPYRAFHPAAKTVSENHISKRRPDLVRRYGKYLWLDPTAEEVKKHSLSVIKDIVTRYDADGIHFDDYFYPYPEKDANGVKIQFPDEENWQKYTRNGGKLARDDWRRENVNDFIERTAREIKKYKPQMLFGISPFGIWQPMADKDIKGFNAYEELYADARKWLRDGTVDYLAPQLYWETSRKGLSFPVLLDWWKSQNVKRRNIWAGMAAYRVGSNADFTADEIASQINETRRDSLSTGAIFFSFKSLRNDLGEIQKVLRDKAYQKDAIMPLSPWLKAPKLSAPQVSIRDENNLKKVSWQTIGKDKPFQFIIYVKDKNGWNYSLVPFTQKSAAFSNERQIEKIVVKSVDRLGNISR